MEEYTESNRKAWNQTNAFHQKAKGEYYRNKFKELDFMVLDDFEKDKLNELNIKGKIVGQLCCNNGIELISIVRLGAKEGIGFDIADNPINDAKEFAKIANVNCKFIRVNIYAIEKEYNNRFDIIYISAGSINWLPDLDGFFKVVNKLLKKGGKLMIYEIHPFSEIFASDDDNRFNKDNPYKIIKSYFNKKPQPTESGIDYLGKEKYDSETSYWFTHKVSDIINGSVKNGILISEWNEYPFDVSACLEHLQDDKFIPLSFLMIGTKL
jgi:SAM-dependent methyltransferase